MSNPWVRKRGGGRQRVQLLCSSGFFVWGDSSFFLVLCFAISISQSLFGQTCRLAFAPSGVLLGLIFAAIAFAGGGFIFLLFWSPSSCPQRIIWACLSVASWNFQKFIKEGKTTFHSISFQGCVFSPVYVCVFRLFFNSINPSKLWLRTRWIWFLCFPLFKPLFNI